MGGGHVSAASDLLAAMPDTAALEEYWRRIFAEMTSQAALSAYERGFEDGAVEAVRAYKAAQHGIYRDALTERARWHLCCRRCRLNGHRDGCTDCEDRDRETFGQPSPDESPAELAAQARASWEPLGLAPPGMVHLGGKLFHRHSPCTAACNYAPGWYRPEEAAAILARLPGDYRNAISELQRKADGTGPMIG